MAEEQKKPDEEVQVDSPETIVVEEDKKEPEKKFEESPEDIKKSREFHQKQAQDAKEQLKQAQTEMDQIFGEVEGADPMLSRQQPESEQKKEQEKKEEQESEIDQNDIGAIVRQAVRQEVGSLRADVMADVSSQQEAQQKERDMRDYVAEQQRARKAVAAYQAKYDIPDDIMSACDKEAAGVVGDLRYLGAFTRWAKSMRGNLDHYRLQSSITQKATTAEANAAAQIDHAGKVAQPVGSAISPPEAGSLEKWNQQQADDIAEDDPPVG